MRRISWVLLCLFSFTACEDTIEIDLDEGEPQLNVDAWINDQPEQQVIILKETGPYFKNEALPPVREAEINILDASGNLFVFEHEENGRYVWMPPDDKSIGAIGTEYTLVINYKGHQYHATSVLNPVPPIDSIGYEYVASNHSFSGYLAALYAFDIKGRVDYYWIKSYKNSKFFNDPAYLNIAADGAYSPNGIADGVLFIPPIRYGITDRSNPFTIGDTVKVEILSITSGAYNFITEAREQMVNGGLFATPPANVKTNIVNITDPDKKAVGWFCVSAVARQERVIE